MRSSVPLLLPRRPIIASERRFGAGFRGFFERSITEVSRPHPRAQTRANRRSSRDAWRASRARRLTYRYGPVHGGHTPRSRGLPGSGKPGPCAGPLGPGAIPPDHVWLGLPMLPGAQHRTFPTNITAPKSDRPEISAGPWPGRRGGNAGRPRTGTAAHLSRRRANGGLRPAPRRATSYARRGCNSVGRVSASQAECRGFESRLPLHESAGLRRFFVVVESTSAGPCGRQPCLTVCTRRLSSARTSAVPLRPDSRHTNSHEV